MIEVIYKEEKKEAKGNESFFYLPKNIRQIGLLSERYKIYMEDYAYTFLKKTAEEVQETAKCALLLGQTNFAEGITYVFIRCALLVEEPMSPEHMEFSEEVWKRLHEQMEKYFPEQEIVGWFFTAQGIPMSVEDMLYRTHVTYFGADKVLFLIEPQEKEEAFFRYDENNRMCKQPGYYIYYEKNHMMQAYMIAHNENQPLETEEEVDDEAVKNFRKIIQEKNEKKEAGQNGFMGWVPYAASVCLAISVLAVGSNFLGSYDKMQQAAGQIQQVSMQFDKRKVTQAPGETPMEPASTPQPQESLPQTTGQAASFQETSPARDTPAPTPQVPKETPVPRITENPQSTSAPNRETAVGYSGRSYQIKEGDTLNNIAMEFYGSLDVVEEICRKNGLDEEETIYPGQIIVLP